MENVDKRKDLKMVTAWESYRKRLGARALIAKPNFHSAPQFTENMMAIQLDRVQTYYNKPIYIGFSVLKLSKWKMYQSHYDYMKPKYNDNITLNYMDTDSFIYTIQTEDYYKDIIEDIDSKLDTSEYAPDNPYHIPLKNKKFVGYFKDEAYGKIVKEFIDLRSKMYSINIVDSNLIKKAKGIKRTALDGIDMVSYRECLYRKKIIYGNMLVFRSKIHNIEV